MKGGAEGKGAGGPSTRSPCTAPPTPPPRAPVGVELCGEDAVVGWQRALAGGQQAAQAVLGAGARADLAQQPHEIQIRLKDRWVWVGGWMHVPPGHLARSNCPLPPPPSHLAEHLLQDDAVLDAPPPALCLKAKAPRRGPLLALAHRGQLRVPGGGGRGGQMSWV